MKRLDKIEARANAATKGPWMEICTDYGGDQWIRRSGQHHDGPDLTDADAEFITNARTDIPWLIEVVREGQNLAKGHSHLPDMHCLICAWLKKLEESNEE